MFSPSLDIHRYGLEGYCPASAGLLRFLRLRLALEGSNLIRINANHEVVDVIVDFGEPVACGPTIDGAARMFLKSSCEQSELHNCEVVNPGV